MFNVCAYHMVVRKSSLFHNSIYSTFPRSNDIVWLACDHGLDFGDKQIRIHTTTTRNIALVGFGAKIHISECREVGLQTPVAVSAFHASKAADGSGSVFALQHTRSGVGRSHSHWLRFFF